jgi:hypothetical protein
MGITARTFIDPQSTNRVGPLVEAPDLDSFRRALQSEEAAKAMEYDGVRPETIMMLVES